jgi:hypothetical protein
VWCKEA